MKPPHTASVQGVSTTLPPRQEGLPIPPPPPKKKSLWRIILLAALVIALIPILTASALLMPLPLPSNKTVVIPRGATVQEIALKLQFEGVTPNRLTFRAASRVFANDNLKAGEYEFTPGQNLIDAVVMLRDGHSVVRMLTVAEGLTSAEIINLLRNDPTLSGDLTVIPPEGSLLPETYRYSHGDSRAGLLERMKKSLNEELNDLWAKRDSDIPIRTPQEAVVMASIIEKETGRKAEERPRVAGVFYNRLRKKMRLQSDPTVIYALTNGIKPLGRDLTRTDLSFASPYNTYISDGLPPGPISNPGRAALAAALHPERNDFLYFVADGTGGHAFAKELADHNKNVNHWINLPKP